MTALSFALDPADTAVLAVLKAVSNLPVHIGVVADSDDSAKTISAPLPYLLYGSTLGFASSHRTGGPVGRVMTFTTTYTHASFFGAKSVGLAVREYLDGARVTIDARERRIRLADPDADITIEHDDGWTRPDGGALFYGMDRWSVVAK